MTNKILFNTDNHGDPLKLGDIVILQGQEKPVVACEKTGVLMLNIDADQLKPGDLTFIKSLGLTISNPDTDKPIALGVDYTSDTFGHRVAAFIGGAALQHSIEDYSNDSYDDTEESDSSSDDDNDDSSFFSGDSFGGGSSFGGFGGGSFSGGGASGSF